MAAKDDNLPDLNPEGPAQSTCWTPRRCELRDWLRKNAPSLAELYEGSASLLFDYSVPGYTRFVAHSVREIRNRLPDAISGTTTSNRLDYKSLLDGIADGWDKAGLADLISAAKIQEAKPDTKFPEITLPLKLGRKISSLIADHKAARERPWDTAVRLFTGGRQEDIKFINTLRPTVLQWLDVTNWFMALTHDSGATDGDQKIDELKNKFEIFEGTLLSIIRGRTKFFVPTDELDEILEETNS